MCCGELTLVRCFWLNLLFGLLRGVDQTSLRLEQYHVKFIKGSIFFFSFFIFMQAYACV